MKMYQLTRCVTLWQENFVAPVNCSVIVQCIEKLGKNIGLNVPRDLVHAVMYELDPEGLESRAVGARRKNTKGCFSSKGPNWVHSVDGHDKLMGYQNSTFPLAVYGCLDTCSRKLL